MKQLTYRKYKLNKQGYGLTNKQIALLDRINLIHFDDINLELADEIEHTFTRFNFSIGSTGDKCKCVLFAPFDIGCNKSDEGKYFLKESSSSLTESYKILIKRIPELFNYCANPKLFFSVNKK